MEARLAGATAQPFADEARDRLLPPQISLVAPVAVQMRSDRSRPPWDRLESEAVLRQSAIEEQISLRVAGIVQPVDPLVTASAMQRRERAGRRIPSCTRD